MLKPKYANRRNNMLFSKKAKNNALFDIANSEIMSDLVFSFSNDTQKQDREWINTLINKKDRGHRELIVGADFALIRAIIKNAPCPETIIYGFEKSGYSKIQAHRNLKGKIDVNAKTMIKLFAEELASQVLMGVFNCAYKVCGFTSKGFKEFGEDVVTIKYNVKKKTR